MKSQIKHIAVMSQNAARLFKFYECLFDLKKANSEASRELQEEQDRKFGYPILASNRVASPFDATIIASDGNIGLSFNRRRPGYPGGLDHFGIEVDDLEGLFAKLKEKYPQIGVVKRPDNRPFASYSTHDIPGTIFDLTKPGIKNIRGVWADVGRHQQRYIKHLTIRTMHPAALADASGRRGRRARRALGPGRVHPLDLPGFRLRLAAVLTTVPPCAPTGAMRSMRQAAGTS